jgi:ubiquinone/menaquinone biosynthesis C-methylase UbiE
MKILLFIEVFFFCFFGNPILAAQYKSELSVQSTIVCIRDFMAIKGLRTVPSLSQEIYSDENDRMRDEQFNIDKGLDTVGIKPGMTVGEVGAGWGYLVFKLARRVGPSGTVLANDINSSALKILRTRAEEKGFYNIKTILGTNNNPRLPKGALDMVFMHDTIHLLDKPVELFNNLAPSLKRSGKAVIIEWEREKGIIDRSGKLIHPSEYRTVREFLELFSQTVFQVDRVDTTTLPYLTIFILSVKDAHIDVRPENPRIIIE